MKIGPWEVQRKLSQGGFAQVYLCRRVFPDGQEKVGVVKLPLPGTLTDDDAIRTFRKEAAIAMKLSHGNVVSVFEVGEHESVPYLVMEYIAGLNLAQLTKRMGLAQSRWSIEMLAHVVRELVYALQHAHGRTLGGIHQQIVHRDIKAANVMVSESGGVHLTDFGIAAAVSVKSSKMSTKGTLPYMAPEHLVLGEATQRSDLFGVGVILWELIEGRRFRGDIPDDRMHYAVAKGEFSPLTRTDLPGDLRDLCLALLSYEPEDRPAIELALEVLERYGSQRSRLKELCRLHGGEQAGRTGHTKVEIRAIPELDRTFAVAAANRDPDAPVGFRKRRLAEGAMPAELAPTPTPTPSPAAARTPGGASGPVGTRPARYKYLGDRGGASRPSEPGSSPTAIDVASVGRGRSLGVGEAEPVPGLEPATPGLEPVSQRHPTAPRIPAVPDVPTLVVSDSGSGASAPPALEPASAPRTAVFVGSPTPERIETTAKLDASIASTDRVPPASTDPRSPTPPPRQIDEPAGPRATPSPIPALLPGPRTRTAPSAPAAAGPSRIVPSRAAITLPDPEHLVHDHSRRSTDPELPVPRRNRGLKALALVALTAGLGTAGFVATLELREPARVALVDEIASAEPEAGRAGGAAARGPRLEARPAEPVTDAATATAEPVAGADDDEAEPAFPSVDDDASLGAADPAPEPPPADPSSGEPRSAEPASPEPSAEAAVPRPGPPEPKPTAPKVALTLKIGFIDYAQVQVDRKVYRVRGDKQPRLSVRAGSHHIRWRFTEGAEWAGSATLDLARDKHHVLVFESHGPRHAVLDP